MPWPVRKSTLATAPWAITRVPVVGDAADQKFAVAIDDRQRRRIIVAAAAAPEMHDQLLALAVAFEIEECGRSSSVLLELGRLATLRLDLFAAGSRAR